MPRWHHLSLHVQTGLYDESPSLFPYLRYLLTQVVTPRDLGRVPTKLSLAGGSTLKADTWRCYTETFSIFAYYHVIYEGPNEDERRAIEGELQKPKTERTRTRKAADRRRSEAAQALVDANGATAPAAKEDLDLANADGVENVEGFVEWFSAEAEEETAEAVKRNAPRRAFQEGWKARVRDATSDELRLLRIRLFEAWCDFVSCARLTLRHSMTPAEAFKAGQLGARYARSLVDIFGQDATAANHHYLLHIPELVALHGPAHSTMTLAHERLNGIIAAIPTNAHPGELETTLLREFCSLGSLDALQNSLAVEDGAEDPDQDALFSELRRATRDERGPVAALLQPDTEQDPYS